MFRKRARAGSPEPAVPAAGGHAARSHEDPGGPEGWAEPEPCDAPPPGVDVSVPHPARVWNFWLGGRDFFAADRAAGEAISREFPHLAETARAERAFGVRAVRFLAGPARVRQFLDVGAGLPAGGNTHEIAQGIAPATGIVYADNDPAILMHAKTLLNDPMRASSPEGVVSYIDADLRDVAAILAGAASTLEMTQPVALIMLGALGYIEDFGAARSITSQLLDALPAGSYLLVADGVSADSGTARAQQRYNQSAPAPYFLREPEQLASFFDGLELVEPGVVPCSRWRPDIWSSHARSSHARGRDVRDPGGEGPAWCGVARKPA